MAGAPAPVRLETLMAHREWVRRVAHALVADEQAAEDLQQDLWLKVLERPPRIRGSIRGWLAATLRNAFLNRRRGEARRAARERGVSRPEAGASAADLVADAEALRRVVDAVLGLQEPYRTTLLLRYYEDLPPAAMAARLGIPVETVRTRVRRAVALLREVLDGGGGDRSALALLLAPLLRPRTAAPLAGAAAAGWLAGGALVAKKTALVAAVAVLLLGGAWLVHRGGGEDGPRPAASTSPVAAARAREAAAKPAPLLPPGVETASVPVAVKGPSIRGRVVERDGTPAGGLRVLSLPEDLPDPVLPEVGEGGRGPARETRTGPDGRFVVALDPDHALYALFASAPGRSPEVRKGLRPGEELEIVLGPRCDLVGTVRDLDGHPVAGARVLWLVVLSGIRIEREGVSAEDGTYRVVGITSPWTDQLEAPQSTVVRAAAEGFAPFQAPGQLVEMDGKGNRRLDLYLPRGATIRGRVVDAETGTPLPGARVLLWSNESVPGVHMLAGYRNNPYSMRALGEKRTEPDGTFSLPGVPAGGVSPVGLAWADFDHPWLGFLLAWAEGYARNSERVTVPGDGAVVDYEIRLRPAGSIRGRVVDGAGHPVAGAGIWAGDEAHPDEAWTPPPAFGRLPGPSAVTGADGTYLVEAAGASRTVPGGSTVTARAKDAIPEDPGKSVTVEVHPSAVAEAPDIVLAPTTPSVIVEVRDGRGEPVFGAPVAPPAGAWSPARAVTDREGRCRVAFGPKDPALGKGAVRFLVLAKGFAPALSDAVVPSLDEPPVVRVSLLPGHCVAGHIRHASGVPAGGVPVIVSDGRIPIERVGRPGPWQEGLVAYGGSTAGQDGSFLVVDLPEGPYSVTADTSYPAPQGVDRPWVHAAVPDVPTDARDVELAFPAPPEIPRGARVEATVVDAATNRPILACYLEMSCARGSAWSHKIAPGRFSFDEVLPGTWSLRARAEGYILLTLPGVLVTAEGPANPLEVRLERGARARGRVRTAEGTPLRRARIFLEGRGSGAGSASGEIGEDGGFEVLGLKAGARYRVKVASSDEAGSPSWWLPVDGTDRTIPASGGDVDLDLLVSRSAALVVRIRSPRLPPQGRYDDGTEEQKRVSEASRISLVDPAGTVVWEGRIYGESGIEEVLPPGSFTVRLSMPGTPARERPVTLDPAVPAHLEFEVP